MPDTPAQAENTTQETPHETKAPNLESREAVYARLYENQPQPTADAAPPAAQVAAVAEPDYKTLYAQLAATVEDLKNSRNAPPPSVVEATPPTKDWFTLLQEGKRTEAEQALIDLVTNSSANKIKQQTLVEGAELARTERAIESFNNQIRTDNPDLIDVEDLISLKAKDIFEQKQGSIKSHKDYIDTYQSAVNTAVIDIRKILQRTRAVAKNEALTTRREVLGASTMTPNDIRSINRDQPTEESQQTPDVSPQNYMEMRKANADARRNPHASEQRRVVGL